MTLAIRLLAEPVRTLAAASIGAAYMGIGTGLDNPSRIIFVQNLTDATVMFSLDGITDHFPLPTGGFLLLDVTTNRTLSQGCFISQGQRLYVKEEGTGPTTGSVYVSSFYGSGSTVG